MTTKRYKPRSQVGLKEEQAQIKRWRPLGRFLLKLPLLKLSGVHAHQNPITVVGMWLAGGSPGHPGREWGMAAVWEVERSIRHARAYARVDARGEAVLKKFEKALIELDKWWDEVGD